MNKLKIIHSLLIVLIHLSLCVAQNTSADTDDVMESYQPSKVGCPM
jgi:hypothetical protein